MENYATTLARPQQSALPLKNSIRDMIRLQRDYNLSDELFWEVFNNRVLLNEQIDIDDFLRDIWTDR